MPRVLSVLSTVPNILCVYDIKLCVLSVLAMTPYLLIVKQNDWITAELEFWSTHDEPSTAEQALIQLGIN